MAALQPIPSVQDATRVALRAPDEVMRLARLGAFHQTRLSFLRTLLARAARERWEITRVRFDFDVRGVGVGIYRVRVAAGRIYSLVAFGHDLPPEMRTDRVIAEAWDATFALFDGVPTADDVERLAANVPRQEAGRYHATDLVLARANRSVRLFDYVVSELAAGRQPDRDRLERVGYLMRTTAVYGNGKFGIADRDRFADRPELSGPFQAEMLTVYLIRTFTLDLVQLLARLRAPASAIDLDRAAARRLGIGNATGLGMAPFLVKHPLLIHRWIAARETALARVRSLPQATEACRNGFVALLARAVRLMDGWESDDPVQAPRTVELRHDLRRLAEHVRSTDVLSGSQPWDAIYRFAAATLSNEAQEMTVSLLIEQYGDLVDDQVAEMSADESEVFRIDGRMALSALRGLIASNYDWALRIDHASQSASARFWYVSQEKLEPRLGLRAVEPGADLEQPLAIARDVAALEAALAGCRGDETVAKFLLGHPEFRLVVRRIQLSATAPYAEIRDNLIDASLRAVDILRLKLSFFGVTRFDPRSDKWLRITLFQGAPPPSDLAAGFDDTWIWGTGDGSGAMIVSLNEVEQTALKAARGCGLAWGLAEEVGFAARWLAARDVPWLDALQHALADAARGRAGPSSPFLVGSLLADLAPIEPVSTQAVPWPVLLLPFASAAARVHGSAMRLVVGDLTLEVDGGGVIAGDARALSTVALGPVVGMLRVNGPRASATAPPLARGSTVDPALWARLLAFQARTYVPASTSSRLTGAGSSLEDND